MNKLLIVVIVLLFAVLAVASFIAWQIWSGKNQVPQVKRVSQVSITPSTPSAGLKKIAYVKDNSIWSINSDGTNKLQMLQSSPNKFLSQIVWKNFNTVSYISCDTNCRVTNAGAETNIEVPETENQILTLGWNHAGNHLAYLYRLPDGQMKLDFKTNGVTNTVKNFFAGPGRGGSLDDDVSIYFSPDDKHVLVTNTLTSGNPQEKNTIWVFDSSGKEILAIPIAENGWPTQARWAGPDSFIYKQGDNFYVQNLKNKIPTKLFYSQKSYNPIPFNGGTGQINFWVNTDDLPKVGTAVGFYKPEDLMNNTDLVVLKAKKVNLDEAILPFQADGLSIIKSTDGTLIRDLDSGEISEFAISP